MLSKYLVKIIHLPITLKIKLSPCFNRWLFKAKGAKIGKNFNVLGIPTLIIDGSLSIGNNFKMTSGLGINAVSNFNKSAFHIARNGELKIGDNVGMNSTRIRVNKKIQIGDNVKIGANVLLIDTDSHPIDYSQRRVSNEGTNSSPITIEDDVWIGAQCIVLKGVTIGARSIIGAGSVVTKSIPADCVAAGNPCKVIRKINE